MNFDLPEDQEMMRDMFARFLDANSSMARVRAAEPSGFDEALWKGLAEQGALSIRVPEEAGGLGLGLIDAVVLMEEAGRTLASGPLAEALVALRLLAQLGSDQTDLLARALSGEAVVSLQLLESRLQSSSNLFGNRVALADMAIAPFVRQFSKVDPSWFASQPLPSVMRWLAAILDSPRFVRIMRPRA